MATTNYTLTDITSVVFDGTSLTQVNLDGVSVWPYRKPITITISSDTSNYTLQPSAITGYMAGFTDITFVINSGVVIGSTSNSTTALTISSFASGDTVSVTNNGYIVGAGGRGGDSNSNNDGGGGTAIETTSAVNINNLGIIGGGGGGGGSRNHTSAVGGSGKNTWTIYQAGGPGGGGAGRTAGAAGTRVSYGGNWPGYASAGSLTAGGAGGSGDGGAGAYGGSLGANGSTATHAGGTGGKYLVGSSHVTWIATGTRLGTSST